LSDIFEGYFSRISNALNKTDTKVLHQIADAIIKTKTTQARVYTAGNGGSASTASHLCNDLIKGSRIFGRNGFRAMCLSDSMPVLTCLSNDFSYEEAYAIILDTHAKPGDILILFSGSGNSANVINAAVKAKEMGLKVIGFGGRDGGKMKNLCDICLISPTDNMEELEDLHLCYCHALITCIRKKLEDVWDIEIINHPPAKPFKFALFDFDGTVSLLREGWREIMIPYFSEVLMSVAKNESNEDIIALVTDFVDTLTGKQTIFQCKRLNEEVIKRGGEHFDPYEYKAEYLRRLMSSIKSRHEAIENGEAKPSEHLVPGIEDFLKKLIDAGMKLYLASGTDEIDVISEAKLLKIDHYFSGGIYGARDEISDCSKELVIKQILKENNIAGLDLISFGDGFVEIELVKDIGGYAVAVANNELERTGINHWKRNKLLSAGADAVIPDFTGYERLYKFVTGIR